MKRQVNVFWTNRQTNAITIPSLQYAALPCCTRTHGSYIPRLQQFVIFWHCACVIVDVNKHSWNVTITHAGSDIGSTHFKEVRTKSSNREFNDIHNGLVHCRTKQQKADELVAVVNTALNRARQRLLCYWPSRVILAQEFHYHDLQCSTNLHSK